MKVFLTTSFNMPHQYLSNEVRMLEQLDCEMSVRQRPKSYDFVSKKEANEVVKKNINLIKNADIVIVDLSFSNTSVGYHYHIAWAISFKKPTVVLYDLNTFTLFKSLQATLKGIESEYLIVKDYTNQSLSKILDNSISEAKKLLNTKLNFVIPNKLNSYLEWRTKYHSESKSEFMRRIVEDTMLTDVNYKKHLGL